MKYSAPLDGLRAVAVLGVVVFHIFPKVLPGGFLGVDVFFVLSGYLLTSIISHQLNDGRFSLREFYLRRIQRLLPNAVLTIVTTVALSCWLLSPSAARGVAQHGVWALFSLSNFYIWKTFGGYWGAPAATAPLLHTWSLAVEEQFYLLFPLLMILAFRKGRRAGIAYGIGFLFFASLAFCLGGNRPGAENFYLLPTRAWELCLGAGLAVAPWKRRLPARGWAEALGWLGLTAIVFSFFRLGEGGAVPGASTLIPTVGTLAVLIATQREETAIAGALAWPWMVAVGTLSYSIYLWHWPLIVLGRLHAEFNGLDPQTGAITGFGASLVFALAAYFIVERPLRQRGPGRKRRLQAIAGGFALAVVGSLAIALPAPNADPADLWDPVAFYGKSYDVKPFDIRAAASSPRLYDVIFSQLVGKKAHWREGGIQHLWGAGIPEVVVLGSSHAIMLGKVLDEICRERELSVAFFAADEAPVFINPEVPEYDAARFAALAKWKPRWVIVAERWDGVPGTAEDLDRRLRELLRKITPHAQQVWVLSQVPALELPDTLNLREFASTQFRWKGTLPRIPPDGGEAKRQAAWRVLQKLPPIFSNVNVLNTATHFYLSDGSVRYAEGREVFYIDDDHLSEAGAQELRADFLDILKK